MRKLKTNPKLRERITASKKFQQLKSQGFYSEVDHVAGLYARNKAKQPLILVSEEDKTESELEAKLKAKLKQEATDISKCQGRMLFIFVPQIVVAFWYFGVRYLAPGFDQCETIRLAVTLTTVVIISAYYAGALTHPGGLPPEWRAWNGNVASAPSTPWYAAVADGWVEPPDEEQGKGKHPELDYQVIFCKKCQSYAPPRAHHCSKMGECVLKMDHYCVFLHNTVGLNNHKHFFQFVIYLQCGIIFYLGLVLKSWPTHAVYWYDFENYEEMETTPYVITIVILPIIGIMTFLLLLSLSCQQYLHVKDNNTYIESTYHKGEVGKYSRGSRIENLKVVFGKSCWRWVLPIPSNV